MSIVVAVTGGIATGKSSFCQMFAEAAEAPIISSDAVVHQLYESDEVRDLVRERFGDGVMTEAGEVNRGALGKIVFQSAVERAWLEDLLHPRVLKALKAWIGENEAKDCVIVEVPLLYEVDFPLKRDFDVVVACTSTTQLHRLQKRNQIDLEHAKARIASQLPIPEKILRADVVIWNEGSHSNLLDQARLASRRIRTLSK